jgi:hypothetical protein
MTNSICYEKFIKFNKYTIHIALICTNYIQFLIFFIFFILIVLLINYNLMFKFFYYNRIKNGEKLKNTSQSS